MLLINFVREALRSEEACVRFLQKHGLFTEEEIKCPGKNSQACNSMMRKVSINDTLIWRCTKRSCRTKRSIRVTNSFFFYKDKNGKLNTKMSMCSIMMIVYLFIHTTCTLDQMEVMTGHSRATLVDWLALCREVCAKAMEMQPKMRGDRETPVQVDESYHQGRRKYKRGRLLAGDKKGMKEEFGPWVVGLYSHAYDVRFELVPNRSSNTLVKLVKHYVEPGSTVVTDEWKGYSRVRYHSFDHYTVNHSVNYVDPHTHFHTQAIERAWVETKAYMKRARGAGPMLQLHLDEITWRHSRKRDPLGLFHAFLRDVHNVCNETNIM